MRSLRVMIAEEGEQPELRNYEYYQPTGWEEEWEEPVEYEEGDLPLCSMAGITTTWTIRLHGKIREREITILIDCGASHNYISEKLVRELELPVDKRRKFGVELGNGWRQESEGRCTDVEVEFAECRIKIDYFAFTLGSVDLILGMTWLGTLGVVRMDFGQMSMEFELEGQQVTLRGDPRLCRGPIGVKSLSRTTKAQM